MNVSVKRRSAFWGEIKEIPNIFVDNFKNKNQMAYFLSHNHFDDTKGLFRQIRSYIKSNNGAKIYMSEETKMLLTISHSYFDKDELCDIVEPLKVGMTYTIDKPDGQSFQVTLIPVTHITGAVMFLFKTSEKTTMYTGDFVIEEEKINELTKLHDESGKPLNIDTMYVDAHFDSEDYRYFPSRSLGCWQVVNQIKNWLWEDDRAVAIYHHYPFDYEDIYKEINKTLDI